MTEQDAPDAPSADDEESRERAADADDTLEPGSMPPAEEKDEELTAY